MRPWWLKAVLLLACLSWMPAAHAGIDIETQSLRLSFSESGDLTSAQACFPRCGEKGAKTRNLASAQGLLVLGGGARDLQFDQVFEEERRFCAGLLDQAKSFTSGAYRIRAGRWRSSPLTAGRLR